MTISNAVGHRSILVVDDDPKIRRLLGRYLTVDGYEVLFAGDGQEALRQTSLNAPSLVVLDLSMPVMDGLTALERLREWYTDPIIVLTATDEERQKVKALDLGADDYVTKPFSPPELSARIRAALRRKEQFASAAPDTPVVDVGDFQVDVAAHVVRKGEVEVHLTRTEFALLEVLALNVGKVLSHRQILHAVWGPEYSGETEYLRTFVKQLRRKLERDATHPVHIVTEPGVGYRLVA